MKVPKYQVIQNDLRQQIISGKFENGDKFYTEAELTQIYNVSSITVIRAVNELVKDGYLIRKQGRGTFVSRSRKGKLVEFSDIEIFPLEKETVRVLSCKKENDPRILNHLKLSAKEHYYKIVRLRISPEEPYIYQQSYIPERYIQQPQAPLDHFKSIYQRFKLDFNIHMSEEPYTESNEVTLQLPQEVIEAFHLTTAEPCILQIRKTQFSSTNEILEYVETYKHWRFFKFEITANKR